MKLPTILLNEGVCAGVIPPGGVFQGEFRTYAPPTLWMRIKKEKKESDGLAVFVSFADNTLHTVLVSQIVFDYRLYPNARIELGE